MRVLFRLSLISPLLARECLLQVKSGSATVLLSPSSVARHRRLLVIDCRPRSFFKSFHVQSAISVPFVGHTRRELQASEATHGHSHAAGTSAGSHVPSGDKATDVAPSAQQPHFSDISSATASQYLRRLERSSKLRDADARRFRVHIGCTVVLYDRCAHVYDHWIGCPSCHA